jgi:UTP--glucose-1-phosphate uridylyltransferase
MLPITKGVPKELLPVGRKPMLQLAVEEAVASGITQICIVIREGKEIIRDYFSLRYPHDKKRDHNIEALEQLVASCELTFVYQPSPLGLGDALLQARDFVDGDPFVMVVPDQLMHGAVPATRQLVERWRPGVAIWNSLLRLSKKEVPYFAGARGYIYQDGSHPREVIISRLCTDEETHQMYRDQDYAVRGFGRTIYPPEIFHYLGPEFVNPRTGEIDLLKTFQACTVEIALYGVWLEGEAFDLGTFAGYYYYLPKLWELFR